MKEVGTLKELDVKPGDVVEFTCWGNGGHRTFAGYGEVWAFDIEGVDMDQYAHYWRIISRANTPKLWRDITDAEKGALLLAYHNDKKCLEIWRNCQWVDCGNSTWQPNMAYRIRPEPKVETVTIYGTPNKHVQWCLEQCGLDTHRITFNIIDGKPDTASIKMEAI